MKQDSANYDNMNESESCQVEGKQNDVKDAGKDNYTKDMSIDYKEQYGGDNSAATGG